MAFFDSPVVSDLLTSVSTTVSETAHFYFHDNANYQRAIEIINRPVGYEVSMDELDYWGNHWAALYSLYPAVFFTIMFFILRSICKYHVIPPIARLCGIKSKKVALKFSYQGWLFFFYVSSTIYGHFTLRDKPWVAYPATQSQIDAISAVWRQVPEREIGWYYSYQIGFFIAELYAICVEPKRSDFYEYLAHHIVTIYLLVFSWVCYETRIGSYVLIIHDAVDIFLCFAKIVNYMKLRDLLQVPIFAIFTVSYAFFRMYCLPMLTYQLYHGTFNVHLGCTSCNALFYGLAFALQALHIFWFFLILRVIYRALAHGSRSDVRSDNEDNEDEAAAGGGDGKKKAKNPKKNAAVTDSATKAVEQQQQKAAAEKSKQLLTSPTSDGKEASSQQGASSSSPSPNASTSSNTTNNTNSKKQQQQKK